MVFSYDNKFWNFSDRRVSRLLVSYSAEGEPNYSQAYATSISPLDYLSLTCSDVDAFMKEAKPLDYEKLCAEGQEIYLKVNMATGEVVGHEGRHRMAALYKAGAKKVAISVVCAGEEGRYNRQPMDSLTLYGQDFPYLDPPRKAPGVVTVKTLIPFSEARKWDLRRFYGPMPVLKSFAGKQVYSGSKNQNLIGIILGVSDNEDGPSLSKRFGWPKYIHYFDKQCNDASQKSMNLFGFLCGIQKGKYVLPVTKAPSLEHTISKCQQKKEEQYDFMAMARRNAGLNR